MVQIDDLSRTISTPSGCTAGQTDTLCVVLIQSTREKRATRLDTHRLPFGRASHRLPFGRASAQNCHRVMRVNTRRMDYSAKLDSFKGTVNAHVSRCI